MRSQRVRRVADGNLEPYAFADIDQTVGGGLSLRGKRWGCEDDTVGVAGTLNFLSKTRQDDLADGGLGILVGDGRLRHPGPEERSWSQTPGYNRDRVPAPIFAARLHTRFWRRT